MNHVKIAIVDDHLLFTGALAEMIGHIKNFEVTLRAENGADFLAQLAGCVAHPDVLLLDLSMPVMDGFETLGQLQKMNHTMKIIVLTMNDDENSILRCLKLGASGYLLKNTSPLTLQNAIETTLKKGFYHNEETHNALMQSVNGENEESSEVDLKENETWFLKLACSDLTYKEIAGEMNLSPKTIDGYRMVLFKKFNVKSRVGLVLYALQHKLLD
jgi:DNA-binding NarL/FixJ family response regulator